MKYLTVDQHIKWKGVYIAPGTTVTVKREDQEVWDKLVRLKVAVRVAPKPSAEEAPDDSTES